MNDGAAPQDSTRLATTNEENQPPATTIPVPSFSTEAPLSMTESTIVSNGLAPSHSDAPLLEHLQQEPQTDDKTAPPTNATSVAAATKENQPVHENGVMVSQDTTGAAPVQSVQPSSENVSSHNGMPRDETATGSLENNGAANAEIAAGSIVDATIGDIMLQVEPVSMTGVSREPESASIDTLVQEGAPPIGNVSSHNVPLEGTSGLENGAANAADRIVDATLGDILQDQSVPMAGISAEPESASTSQAQGGAPQQLAPAAAHAPTAPSNDVIELLDDDDEDETDNTAAVTKTSLENQPKRQKMAHAVNPAAILQQNTNNAAMIAHSAYQARAAHMPDWMRHAAQQQPGQPGHPGASLPIPPGQMIQQAFAPPMPQGAMPFGGPVIPYPGPPLQQQRVHPPQPPAIPHVLQAMYKFDQPQYVTLSPDFVPTWNQLVPMRPAAPPKFKPNEHKSFRLSLLNVNEFTITGLPLGFDGPPTSISGLRAPIRKVSREHGKAVYESDKDGGAGKWRIPLGAYHNFFAWLKSDVYTQVEGIPSIQLKIASLERARQEKGYPSVKKLREAGVPKGLARTLAPFQRGGVDFVLEKEGRALIADDMGLGKTIQAIAAMSVYRDEWPIIVFSPSSARYHWANEFKNWLGVDSDVNKPGGVLGKASMMEKAVDDSGNDGEESDSEQFDDGKVDVGLLEESQIHVLTSSWDDVLPLPSTKVVIVSYGLGPGLVNLGKIVPGMFQCAIVDESHMLKNKKSKRTQLLMPILTAAKRCVLLSGTPALARPTELWPQLLMLGAEHHGWWEDEADFIEKYAKKGGARRRAELHTMLTATVMIRRLKGDILKTLPNKLREKASLHVLNEDQRCLFKELLTLLRESKGALGKIARKQHADRLTNGEPAEEEILPEPEPAAAAPQDNTQALGAAAEVLKKDFEKQLNDGKARITHAISSTAGHLGETEQSQIRRQLEGKLISGLEGDFKKKMEQIRDWLPTINNGGPNPLVENQRATVLNRLYSLTGDVKIPVIVDMLKRWLSDPTKGKICIFAHHLSVLDSISILTGLSNREGSTTKYIRIDGSTQPKKRQEQINDFQTDPTIRIALLGITAAGVAVTLTAAATVWFAELFWTPAIMIQAEDRCHRIGQLDRVRCLYFVAKGTLDDVLFKLLEKKLQDIGEFVEGKEKLKYVMNHTYETTKELHTMFEIAGDSESEEDEGMDDLDFDKELPLDDELAHDIEQLGEEEERLLRVGEKDDDDDPEASAAAAGNATDDRKMAAIEIPDEPEHGRTEEEAITLSDDDEDEAPSSVAAAATASVGQNGDATAMAVKSDEGVVASVPLLKSFSRDEPRPKCRLYRMHIAGPTLGISVGIFEGRVVVERLTKERLDRLGEDSKPVVGDVLVGINSSRLPMLEVLKPVLEHLRSVMQKPPVELTFAEDPDFIEYFRKFKDTPAGQRNDIHTTVAPRLDPPVDANGVIDLLDDDD